MLLLVSLCLLAVVLVYVGYPALRPGVSVQPGPSPRTRTLERHQRLLSERAKALAALRELEFERSIGNISDADYAELRQAQRSKAMAMLREIDEIGIGLKPGSGLGPKARTAPSSMLDDAGDHEAYLEDRIAGRRRQLSQAAMPPAPRILD
jgi:hypothetical protein